MADFDLRHLSYSKSKSTSSLANGWELERHRTPLPAKESYNLLGRSVLRPKAPVSA